MRIASLVALLLLAGCGRSITAPETRAPSGQCTYRSTWKDSAGRVYTLTAFYPDTSAYCRSLR